MSSSTEKFHRLHPREYANFTYAYPVVSAPFGKAVSIGVNLNPSTRICTFDCPYCQVDRNDIRAESKSSICRASAKKSRCCLVRWMIRASAVYRCSIRFARCRIKNCATWRIVGRRRAHVGSRVPRCLRLDARNTGRTHGIEFQAGADHQRHLARSARVFRLGIEALLLSRRGEVWAKLDAGTEVWYQRVNIEPCFARSHQESNLVELGRKYPFKIQSFFCRIGGSGLE